MYGDVFLGGGVEFGDAAKHAAAQAAGGDVAEEALDHAQPRSGSRDEVDREARVFLQSFFYLAMFMRGIVIADQMQRLVNLAQKTQDSVSR